MAFLVSVIIITLLQSTVLKDINLLVVLVVFAGLRKGPMAGLLIGAAVGILTGIFSAFSFALNISAYAITGFIAGVIKSRMYYRETPLSEFMFSFSGVILFYGAIFIFTGIPQVFVFYNALLSAALSPLLFRITEI